MPRVKTVRNQTSSTNQVIPMPEVATAVAVRKNGGYAAPIDLEAQIRQRAYELYEERGCTPGLESDDWFRAEREVRDRHNHQHTA